MELKSSSVGHKLWKKWKKLLCKQGVILELVLAVFNNIQNQCEPIIFSRGIPIFSSTLQALFGSFQTHPKTLGLSLDGFFFLYSSSNFWAFNCCFLISRSSSKAPSKKINNSCDSEQQKVAPK